jgi:hypothetical protein
MYCITIQRKGSTHRISEIEKEMMTVTNSALFSKLRSIYSESELTEIDSQGRYIEINADSDEFEYRIKDKPGKAID